ncbi:MAG: histidine--tRNA ligase [Candidatus Thorarchaeota archaeon]|nr:histidine--tRNA ligase [Candidatus Thorarchaeota archaeon]
MRDLIGPEMRASQYLANTAEEVFQLFGYEPLDSPVVELWETLAAKGGEDVEAETFKFKDKGDRDVGLRFDLTVPLARIVATNPQLPKPFKRYAIGKAWRYDRPQAGRYREFTQADADIIGASSPAADAEVVLVALEFLRRVFGSGYAVRINNRKVLRGLVEKAGVKDELAHECFRAIDKLDKIGQDGVTEELKDRGVSSDSSQFLLDAIMLRGDSSVLSEFRSLLAGSETGTQGVDELQFMADVFSECGVDRSILFDMSLARGLDYYTGPVFEGKYAGEPDVGSILGGGRYDTLIEKLGSQPMPATGMSLGISRMIDLVIAQKRAELMTSELDAYVAPIKQPMMKYAMRIRSDLVRAGFTAEVDLLERPLKKLLEVADSKKACSVIIVGPRDLENDEVSVRDMTTKETQLVKIADLKKVLKAMRRK